MFKVIIISSLVFASSLVSVKAESEIKLQCSADDLSFYLTINTNEKSVTGNISNGKCNVIVKQVDGVVGDPVVKFVCGSEVATVKPTSVLQHVRVNERTVEFGDESHNTVIDRSNGLMQTEDGKIIQCSPISTENKF